MLTRIRIAGLGVIDDVTVDLAPGLNVLTGETGAGKTMVVTGLGLLLGDRAGAAVVRTGSAAAQIEGIVEPGQDHPMRARVAEAGGDAGEDEVVLVRTVSALGRSRAYVGGRAAPVGVLAEVGHMLVAVHGQADQWRLRRPEQHRELLDEFGGATIAGLLAAYRHWYARLAELEREREQMHRLERDRTLEAEVLLAGLEEIEAAAPQPGEDEALRAEDELLSNAGALRSGAQAIHEALTGGDDPAGLPGGPGGQAGVSWLLARARSELSALASYDPALAGFESRLAELGYLAADLGADLAAYLADLEADPGRLAQVQARRAELARLTRRFGDTCDDVLEWGQRAAARLAQLESAQARLHDIGAEIAAAREQAALAADRLHVARVQAAGQLGEQVSAELAHLAMGHARVEVAVRTTADPDGLTLPSLAGPDQAPPGGEPGERGGPVAFGPGGADSVEILLAPNPGAPLRSVARVASGGELSRLMLAIEVVTARARPAPGESGSGAGEPEGEPGSTPGDPGSGRPRQEAMVAPVTFVFDEVDAGVGGKAALDVGARLAALARHAQVIVVTHLAQVAAFADRHLVVRKAVTGQVTSSGVTAVEGDARYAELARMMAGSGTETAVRHAAELRAHALAHRGERP